MDESTKLTHGGIRYSGFPAAAVWEASPPVYRCCLHFKPSVGRIPIHEELVSRRDKLPQNPIPTEEVELPPPIDYHLGFLWKPASYFNHLFLRQRQSDRKYLPGWLWDREECKNDVPYTTGYFFLPGAGHGLDYTLTPSELLSEITYHHHLF